MRSDVRTNQSLLFGAAVVGTAVAILAPVLFRGWFPHDEGAIGQAAERILLGEVPHRDFDEIYTGLLSYWHAAAFKVGGIASTTLRIPLFVLSLAWVVALYRIALRVVPAWGAALLAVLCLLWSVPIYPAPMPSWYNLFLATFGALALVRWRETDQARWLVLAGLCGGLSFLVKLTGIVFLIGGGLALVFATAEADGTERRDSGPRGGAIFIGAGIALMLAVLWIPLARAGVRELARFWVPLAIVGSALVVREWRSSSPMAARARRMAAALLPFLTGALAPVVVWCLAMYSLGALEAMLEGVFIAPFRRVSSAAISPPTMLALLPTAVVALALLPRRRALSIWGVTAAVAAGGLWMLIASGTDTGWYRALWAAAWGLPLLAATLGADVVLLAPLDDKYRRRREVAIILTCVAVAALLVEFPFAAPIYTTYALPLSFLALAALVRSQPREGAHHAAPATALLLVFLAFGVFRLLPSSARTLGARFAPSNQTALLDLPRAGLRVAAGDVSQYTELVSTLQALAPGRTLWAGPDAPEVYFLSGMRNRTRVMFDFLDMDAGASRSLADRVFQSEASLVVIKVSPSFSPHARAADLDSLRTRYPNERAVPGFLVLWR